MKKEKLRTTHDSLFTRVFIFFFGWLLFGALSAPAQTVTISPQTGNLMSAATAAQNELGYQAGYGSMWKHVQLPMTFATSDHPEWTSNGTLQNHTNDMLVYKNNLIMIAGFYPVISSLSLPVGYRITSYKITISNNLSKTNDNAVLDAVFPTIPFRRDIKDWYFGEMNKADIPVYDGTAKTLKFTGVAGTKATIPVNNDGGTYTIQRSGYDMGNVLYFGFEGNNTNNLSGFTITSFEITFAADKPFDVPLVPSAISAGKVSLTDNYFLTRKIDVGDISPRQKNGKTFYSYDGSMVNQISASVKLYEQGAVTNGTWDPATPSGQKLISQVRNQNISWYALRNGTYYIEAPTTVDVVSGTNTTTKIPVGYRITGAKFNYTYGVPVTGSTGGFAIKSSVDGVTKYLDIYGNWADTQTIWRQDATGAIYTTSSVDGRNYYLYYYWDTYYTTGANLLNTGTDKSYFTGWRFDTDGDLYYDSYGDRYYLYGKASTTTSTAYPHIDRYYYGDPYANRASAGTNFTPTNYTLTIYDKDGTTVNKVINVNSTMSATNLVYELKGLNNDAVKFSISNAGAASDALLNVTLTMEPLDPYIHSVDMVCKGVIGEEVSKTVFSKDFKLNGGQITYNVPKGFVSSTNPSAQFFFRNLTSEYGDNTYLHYPRTGNSRYNFVASPYYKKVADDLYTNKSIVANDPYNDKIYTYEVGNVPFKFNNADQLSNTSGTTTTQYYVEHQFSKDNYANTAINGTAGVFSTTNALVKDLETKTMYLFTTDETRYNIAPTYNEMHRAFAYYNTSVKLQMGDYSPVVTWKPVYDKTFYLKNGVEVTEKMVGAVLTTTTAGLDSNPNGYLTVKQIEDAMAASIAAKDPGAPTSLDQVLYVDNSKLYAVLSNDAAGNAYTTKQMRAKMSPNTLVYVPAKVKTILDDINMATMLSPTMAKADTNFVITDKMPFFAPYSIKLRPTRYATYVREVTTTNYVNGSQYTTMALPFGVTIDGTGNYSDAASGSTLAFTKLTATNSLSASTATDGTNYFADAKFDIVLPDDSGRTVPNVPYLVTIKSPSSSGLFTVTQKGAFIANSIGNPNSPVFNGTASTGIWNGTSCTFTPKSCYSGAEFDKASYGGLFYFSKDKFVALANLTSSNSLKVFPFRAFYDFQSAAAPAKMFTAFRMVFNYSATGIDAIASGEPKALSIATDNHLIIAEAGIDAPLRVVNLSGQIIANTTIKAGEQKQFSVMPGIYLVNGMKVMVK